MARERDAEVEGATRERARVEDDLEEGEHGGQVVVPRVGDVLSERVKGAEADTAPEDCRELAQLTQDL